MSFKKLKIKKPVPKLCFLVSLPVNSRQFHKQLMEKFETRFGFKSL